MVTKDDAERRLLEAAGQVFAEKGYEGATVREICQRAEVNVASVNYYFRDKERLYIEAVKAACRRQADQGPLPEWPPGVPAEQKLRDYILAFSRRMVGDQESWPRELFLREMAHPTAACLENVRDNIRPDALKLAGILAELLPDVPESKVRLVAFSIVGQCIFYKVAGPIISGLFGEEELRSYDAEGLAEHITRFSLAALGLERPVGQSTQTSYSSESK
jgi:AcrR family transcriptional regulator